jgi:hypothetical protein
VTPVTPAQAGWGFLIRGKLLPAAVAPTEGVTAARAVSTVSAEAACIAAAIPVKAGVTVAAMAVVEAVVHPAAFATQVNGGAAGRQAGDRSAVAGVVVGSLTGTWISTNGRCHHDRTDAVVPSAVPAVAATDEHAAATHRHSVVAASTVDNGMVEGTGARRGGNKGTKADGDGAES